MTLPVLVVMLIRIYAKNHQIRKITVDLEFYPKPVEFTLQQIDAKNHIKEKDFILTELPNEKQTWKKQFVAKIAEISKDNDKNNSITVSFLRQYRQSKNIFVFSEVPDVSEVGIYE